MITHIINGNKQYIKQELYPDKKVLALFSLIYSAEQKILLMILRKVYLNLTLLLLDTLLVNYQWKELRQVVTG
jgi:hypothetical protein